MKIKLSELREFVKSIINEQAGESTKKYSPPLKMTFKDSSGELYTVGANWMGVYDITEEYAVPNGTVYISTKDPKVKIQYMGLTKTFYINKTKVFNPVYAKDLNQRFSILSSPGTKTPNPAIGTPIPVAKGEQFNLYNDKENKTPANKIAKIVSINAPSESKPYVEVITGAYIMKYNCGEAGLLLPDGKRTYNITLTNILNKTYCTTGAGGAIVPKVGRLAQTDQNAPMDVAEIRKIVKALVKEQTAPAAPQPDVNWQKIYSALKAYKNPLEQSGTYNGAPFTRLRWGIHQYYLEFVWDLDITSNSVSFTSLDNQNLKTFESLIGSLGFPTDSRNYMRKSITKDGKPAFTIIYNVDDWSKYDPNTVISTYKKIIDSMQGKAIEKK